MELLHPNIPNVRSIFKLLRDIIHTTMLLCSAVVPPNHRLRAPFVMSWGTNADRVTALLCRLGADVRAVNADLWASIGLFHWLTVLMSSSRLDLHILVCCCGRPTSL